MSLNKIYDSGWVACENGVNVGENPYKYGTDEYEAWANGFDGAIAFYASSVEKQVEYSGAVSFMFLIIALSVVGYALYGIYQILMTVWGFYAD